MEQEKEPSPPTPIAEAKHLPTIIEIGDSGAMVPRDHTQLFRIAKQLLLGGGVPKWFKTVEQVVSAWNFAASLKLPPQPSLRNIAWIEDVPSLFGDLPLGLVNRSGEIESFEEFVIDDKYERICFENKNLTASPFAGVCVAKRKGFDKKSYSFTVEDAKRAGLWERKSSSGRALPWSLYPKVMLLRRARAMMIKTDFPDILSGASIAEYDYGEAPDLRDVTPPDTQSGAALINSKYNDAGVPSGAPTVPGAHSPGAVLTEEA